MSWAPSFFAWAVAPCLIFTKNGFVTSFVISPTLIVAASRDVLADATVATVAVAPTTSNATAASPSRLFALLAIGIFHPPDPDCGIGAALARDPVGGRMIRLRKRLRKRLLFQGPNQRPYTQKM